MKNIAYIELFCSALDDSDRKSCKFADINEYGECEHRGQARVCKCKEARIDALKSELRHG